MILNEKNMKQESPENENTPQSAVREEKSTEVKE